MIVSNTSPLIAFGKLGRIDILIKYGKTIIIPEAVYAEITEKKGTPEALTIAALVEDKSIIIEKTNVHPLLATDKIGQGEKEAISLAYKYRSKLIIDDAIARTYAALLKVETKGSIAVLFKAKYKKIITRDEAKNILDSMISHGFYISTELYGDFLKQLHE